MRRLRVRDVAAGVPTHASKNDGILTSTLLLHAVTVVSTAAVPLLWREVARLRSEVHVAEAAAATANADAEAARETAKAEVAEALEAAKHAAVLIDDAGKALRDKLHNVLKAYKHAVIHAKARNWDGDSMNAALVTLSNLIESIDDELGGVDTDYGDPTVLPILLQREIDGAKEELMQRIIHERKIDQLLYGVTETIARLERQLAEAQPALAAARAEGAAAAARADAAEANLEQVRKNTIEMIQKAAATHEKDLMGMQAESEFAIQMGEELEQQVSDYKKERDAFTAALQDYKKKIADMEEKNQAITDERNETHDKAAKYAKSILPLFTAQSEAQCNHYVDYALFKLTQELVDRADEPVAREILQSVVAILQQPEDAVRPHADASGAWLIICESMSTMRATYAPGKVAAFAVIKSINTRLRADPDIDHAKMTLTGEVPRQVQRMEHMFHPVTVATALAWTLIDIVDTHDAAASAIPDAVVWLAAPVARPFRPPFHAHSTPLAIQADQWCCVHHLRTFVYADDASEPDAFAQRLWAYDGFHKLPDDAGRQTWTQMAQRHVTEQWMQVREGLFDLTALQFHISALKHAAATAPRAVRDGIADVETQVDFAREAESGAAEALTDALQKLDISKP